MIKKKVGKYSIPDSHTSNVLNSMANIVNGKLITLAIKFVPKKHKINNYHHP
jgi:hypothetical protein